MKTRTRRSLIGCLAGCGVLMLLGIGSCVSFVVWLNTPGHLLQPETLLGEDTTGYVEWRLSLDDPETELFVERLLDRVEKLQETSTSRLPPVLGELLRRTQRRNQERGLRKLFPAVFAWTVSRGQTESVDLHVFSVSVRGMAHRMILADWFLRWFLGQSRDVQVIEHVDERIYVVPPSGDRVGFAVFIHHGDLFVTSGPSSAKLAVEQLAAEGGGHGAPTDLERQLAGLDPDAPLRGAISNARGEVRRVADWLGIAGNEGADALWRGLRGLVLTGGFRGQGQGSILEIELDLLGGEPWARSNVDTAGSIIDAWLADALLQVDTTTQADGDGIHVTLRIDTDAMRFETPEANPADRR